MRRSSRSFVLSHPLLALPVFISPFHPFLAYPSLLRHILSSLLSFLHYSIFLLSLIPYSILPILPPLSLRSFTLPSSFSLFIYSSNVPSLHPSSFNPSRLLFLHSPFSPLFHFSLPVHPSLSFPLLRRPSNLLSLPPPPPLSRVHLLFPHLLFVSLVNSLTPIKWTLPSSLLPCTPPPLPPFSLSPLHNSLQTESPASSPLKIRPSPLPPTGLPTLHTSSPTYLPTYM